MTHMDCHTENTKKKGLFVLVGESFRLGGQGTRNRGSDESYIGQQDASPIATFVVSNMFRTHTKLMSRFPHTAQNSTKSWNVSTRNIL